MPRTGYSCRHHLWEGRLQICDKMTTHQTGESRSLPSVFHNWDILEKPNHSPCLYEHLHKPVVSVRRQSGETGGEGVVCPCSQSCDGGPTATSRRQPTDATDTAGQ